jgi:hypothetical protein
MHWAWGLVLPSPPPTATRDGWVWSPWLPLADWPPVRPHARDRDVLAAYQALCAARLVYLQREVPQAGPLACSLGRRAQIHASPAEQQLVAALRQAGLSVQIGCPTSPVSGIACCDVPEGTPNFR